MGHLASIEPNGAVLLGETVTCDAHAPRKIRIITHAHHDHLWGLKKSLSFCDAVLMTPATLELVRILREPMLPFQPNVKPLDYRTPLEVEEGTITFLPSRHILGSCQVVLDLKNGRRVAYTGDFRYPGIPVVEDADILVMEATYGRPEWRRPFDRDMPDILADFVKEKVEEGPVFVFGYHGKLQEVMSILWERGINAPLVASGKVYEVAVACKKFGMKLEVLNSKSEEGKEAVKSGRFVAFYHARSAGARKLALAMRATIVELSGWQFSAPIVEERKRHYTVAFSDHADFDGLLAYVEEARPKRVITDARRIGDAEELAKQIKRRLGIPAKPMPSKGTSGHEIL